MIGANSENNDEDGEWSQGWTCYQRSSAEKESLVDKDKRGWEEWKVGSRRSNKYSTLVVICVGPKDERGAGESVLGAEVWLGKVNLTREMDSGNKV